MSFREGGMQKQISNRAARKMCWEGRMKKRMSEAATLAAAIEVEIRPLLQDTVRAFTRSTLFWSCSRVEFTVDWLNDVFQRHNIVFQNGNYSLIATSICTMLKDVLIESLAPDDQVGDITLDPVDGTTDYKFTLSVYCMDDY
jgi:hypothetical protein